VVGGPKELRQLRPKRSQRVPEHEVRVNDLTLQQTLDQLRDGVHRTGHEEERQETQLQSTGERGEQIKNRAEQERILQEQGEMRGPEPIGPADRRRRHIHGQRRAQDEVRALIAIKHRELVVDKIGEHRVARVPIPGRIEKMVFAAQQAKRKAYRQTACVKREIERRGKAFAGLPTPEDQGGDESPARQQARGGEWLQKNREDGDRRQGAKKGRLDEAGVAYA
jgi:hypothetical protein